MSILSFYFLLFITLILLGMLKLSYRFKTFRNYTFSCLVPRRKRRNSIINTTNVSKSILKTIFTCLCLGTLSLKGLNLVLNSFKSSTSSFSDMQPSSLPWPLSISLLRSSVATNKHGMLARVLLQ